MSSTGDIRDIKAFFNIQGTPSDFSMYKKYGLRAASDLDFCTVQHGHALIIEGKQLLNEVEMKVPAGQAYMLCTLDRPSNQHVRIVGYTRDIKDRKFYIVKPQQANNGRFAQDKHNVTCSYISLNDAIGPLTEEEYCKWVVHFVDSFKLHKVVN